MESEKTKGVLSLNKDAERLTKEIFLLQRAEYAVTECGASYEDIGHTLNNMSDKELNSMYEAVLADEEEFGEL